MRTMPMRRTHKHHSGFTVIELITVLTIVVIIGYSTSLMLKHVMASYERIKDSQEMLTSARKAFIFLSQDLSNARISSSDAAMFFKGTAAKLEFSTAVTLSQGVSRMARITYERDAGNRLVRTLTYLEGAAATETSFVAGNLTGITFRYWYRNPAGTIVRAGQASWDSTIEFYPNTDREGEYLDPDGLPSLVEISLNVRGDDAADTVKTYETKIFIPSSR